MLPEPNTLPLTEGLDLARTVMPEGYDFAERYLEANYTFIFPLVDGDDAPTDQAILVVKPAKTVTLITLPVPED